MPAALLLSGWGGQASSLIKTLDLACGHVSQQAVLLQREDALLAKALMMTGVALSLCAALWHSTKICGTRAASVCSGPSQSSRGYGKLLYLVTAYEQSRVSTGPHRGVGMVCTALLVETPVLAKHHYPPSLLSEHCRRIEDP